MIKYIILLSISMLSFTAYSQQLQVFSAGGGVTAGGGNNLQYTIGEAIIFPAGATKFTQGFNQPSIDPICEDLAELINNTDKVSLCLDEGFSVGLENSYTAAGDEMVWYLTSAPMTQLSTTKNHTYSSSVPVVDSLYAVVSEGFCTDTSEKIPFEVLENNAILFEEGNTALCEGNIVLKLAIPTTEIHWLLDEEQIDGATQEEYTVLVSGSYGVSITNSICSSDINTLTISSDLLSIGIIRSSNELVCSETGDSYQWYIEINNRTYSIVGATGKNYLPLYNGDYKVEVLNDVCRGVSSIESYSSAQYNAQRFAQFLADGQVVLEGKSSLMELSPNPSNGKFTFRYLGIINDLININIYNTVGQLVFTEQYASTTEIPITLQVATGLYIFVAEVNGEVYKEKLVID
jgi:hypothetical protein